MTYFCPVCAFGELTEGPANFNVCPCCGTEFGYTDASIDHHHLRMRWIQNGAQWFASSEEWPCPQDWNPFIQLAAGGLVAELSGEGTGATTFTYTVQGPSIRPKQIDMRITAFRTEAPKAA